MMSQLLIGTAIISAAIVIAAGFIGVAAKLLTQIGAWLATPPHAVKTTISLIGVSLWLLGAITAVVWMWALCFVAPGVFAQLEPALYFATVTLTTLGYGDITLPEGWRLLSGICAANGLLLFGLSVAFLSEFFSRLKDAQKQNGATPPP